MVRCDWQRGDFIFSFVRTLGSRSTQHGNARQFILTSDSDRLIYLDLLAKHCRLCQLILLGYCLISNHVSPENVPPVPGFSQGFSRTQEMLKREKSCRFRSQPRNWLPAAPLPSLYFQ